MWSPTIPSQFCPATPAHRCGALPSMSAHEAPMRPLLISVHEDWLPQQVAEALRRQIQRAAVRAQSPSRTGPRHRRGPTTATINGPRRQRRAIQSLRRSRDQIPPQRPCNRHGNGLLTSVCAHAHAMRCLDRALARVPVAQRRSQPPRPGALSKSTPPNVLHRVSGRIVARHCVHASTGERAPAVPNQSKRTALVECAPN